MLWELSQSRIEQTEQGQWVLYGMGGVSRCRCRCVERILDVILLLVLDVGDVMQ